MIKPEMVPDNVEQHFRWCAANTFMTTRECLAAALSAWPGAFRNDMEEAAGVRRRIIPPLPEQENSDA